MLAHDDDAAMLQRGDAAVCLVLEHIYIYIYIYMYGASVRAVRKCRTCVIWCCFSCTARWCTGANQVLNAQYRCLQLCLHAVPATDLLLHERNVRGQLLHSG